MHNRYFRSPKRIDPSTTYVFPRCLGGGVILGGSRQDNDWSDEWDEELGQDIMQRCCELCPELGAPEDLQIIARNVGLRREYSNPLCSVHMDMGGKDDWGRLLLTSFPASRIGGPRIETEKGKWDVPVVHCYGHSGAGYQASWYVYSLTQPHECVSLLTVTRGTAEHVLELVGQTLKPRSKI